MYFVSRGMLFAVEHLGSADPDKPERLVRAMGNHEFFGDEGVLSGALVCHAAPLTLYRSSLLACRQSLQ